MLNIDQFFYAALRDNKNVRSLVQANIFNTERTIAEQRADDIPYIIVTFDGANNDGGYKDEVMARLNEASVSILCVATRRSKLAELTETVMNAIREACETYDIYEAHSEWKFYISGINPSAKQVEYDENKPCYFQWLVFDCKTTNKP